MVKELQINCGPTRKSWSDRNYARSKKLNSVRSKGRVGVYFFKKFSLFAKSEPEPILQKLPNPLTSFSDQIPKVSGPDQTEIVRPSVVGVESRLSISLGLTPTILTKTQTSQSSPRSRGDYYIINRRFPSDQIIHIRLYSVRGLELSEMGGSRGCPGRLWDRFLWQVFTPSIASCLLSFW